MTLLNSNLMSNFDPNSIDASFMGKMTAALAELVRNVKKMTISNLKDLVKIIMKI